MTRDRLVLALQQEYAMRREENLRLFEQKRDAACDRCPGLRKLLDARHAAVMGGVRAGLLRPGNSPDVNAELPNVLRLLNAEIAEALRAGGLEANALAPEYACPQCRDEGYLYTPSRRMCACMERELNRRMLCELGLADDRQTFERFNEALFSGEPLAGGVSQRQAAMLARRVCEAYANDFPKTETRNLLLMGQSGLGKTYLLNAIAHRTAERGVLPTLVTAYRFLEVARKAYIENSGERMADLLTAPLLLLDDLGTEPLMQNITITQLFNLLNERARAGLHTVVSTNLDMDQLKERYTERIASRLMDGTSWRRLTLIGGDVRMRLKRSGAS